MKVIVTGVSGYIGGQIALQLKDAGHTVIGIDRAGCILPVWLDKFVLTDFAENLGLATFIKEQPDAIIHCAGTSLVGPSIADPAEYYHNNVIKTITLLDLVRKSLPKTRVIFSSSAAAYGIPVMTPCQEVDPAEPISPYGDSKLMIERVLESYHRAYKLDYVAFRYFNACGADPQARHGQALGATHIMARVLESVKNNTQFVCNGNSYETSDGTCVRDYVHVDDIARAHIIALSSASVPSGVYNLGTSHGASNLEVVAAAEKATGRAINVEFGPARTGDPDILSADAGKFSNATGWRPAYTLDDMAAHAWTWYNK
jgi:UDP-glucose-4-epimerase GalE